MEISDKEKIKILEHDLDGIVRIFSALIVAQGGKVRIPKSALLPSYELKHTIDLETSELVIEAREL